MKIITTNPPAGLQAANDNDRDVFIWDETENRMKALYDEIASEPVPQSLIDLVNELATMKEAV